MTAIDYLTDEERDQYNEYSSLGDKSLATQEMRDAKNWYSYARGALKRQVRPSRSDHAINRILKGRAGDTLDRFILQTNFTRGGCWTWTGNTNGNGYGQMKADDKVRKSHIWAYEHFTGLIPDGHEVDHMCRNQLCCNPAHLQTLTRADHIKATRARSEKIDLSEYPAIVARYEAGELQKDIARSYDVSYMSVTRILVREGAISNPDIQGKFYAKAKLNESGCLIWQGKPRDGRPVFTYGGSAAAYRFSMAWSLDLKGPWELPDGHDVHHTCNEPMCVNPEHLLLLTSAEHLALHAAEEN